MTRRGLATVVVSFCLVGCGPEPGSVADTPGGVPFAILSLPSPSQVEAPAEFEKRIRREFLQFAKDSGLKVADDSDIYKKMKNREPLVWLSAYEKTVLILVDWNGHPAEDGFKTNLVAVLGDYSAERPRQVHDALVRRLKERNIPFKVEKAPERKGDG